MLTAEDIWQVLERTATDLGDQGRDDYYGHGRINAAAAAEFVSRPNWIEHGELGQGSSSPLVIQLDSLAGSITIVNDSPSELNGTHACVMYHLVGVKQFTGDFVTPPAVWVRRAQSVGLPQVLSWDDDQAPPWGGVVGSSVGQGIFETFVYRLTSLGNRFYPCAPEDAKVAYTAIAPSGTLKVVPGAGREELSLRTRMSPAREHSMFEATGQAPGPLRVEVFDVSGRRVATLFDGTSTTETAVYEWDGRLDGGGACRPGIYLCRCEQPGRRAACRFALLR